MKIVAFAGTNSPTSINKVLVEYVAKQFDSNNVEFLDLNDYEMPIYGVHREQQSGVPQEAKNFAEKIDSADLVIMSLAEHNSSYSVAFKNVFDWVSRIQGRPHWGDVMS
ncbi:NADPH-dependent FMN reductase, partial [Elizabethkingia meningoseptica]|uniref:NADPH-dependent FMN reductase n=1 Tax=Elizabethkingia meningoseptica TaxID=238 RepID=UPI001625D176